MSINYGYQKMFDSLKGRNCLPETETAPKKERLFGEFFYKNDFAVLCGPEGSGRSILAMQIADSISRGKPLDNFTLDSEARPVVFLDFEGNHDEFARRYSLDGKQPYPFHENFNVVRFHQKFRGYTSMQKDFLRELNTTLAPHQDGVLIINNLDYWKCFMSESYAIAAIKELQANNRFSVLLISNLKGNPAHKQVTPNRAGKLLTTMTDSIFAMNFSQKDADTRYLVQLKTKGSKPIYHSNHVAEFTLGKEHNFTGCRFAGFGTEQEHIATPPTDFEMKIIELSLNKPELRLAEIADQLKTNKMRVDRVLKKYASKPETVGNLVTSTFENKIPLTDSLQQGNDNPTHNRIAPPYNFDPFRGNVELSNHPSDSGVKQPEDFATVVTSTFENTTTACHPGRNFVQPAIDPELVIERRFLQNDSVGTGVDKTDESPAILVTSTFEKEIPLTDSLHQGNDNPPHNSLNPPLPTDPFRGEVQSSNHPSGPGVKQPETIATVVTSTFENPIKTYTPRLPHPFRGNVDPPDHPSEPGVEEETLEESLKTLDAMISGYCKPPAKTPGPEPDSQKQSLTYSQQLKKRFADARKKK